VEKLEARVEAVAWGQAKAKARLEEGGGDKHERIME